MNDGEAGTCCKHSSPSQSQHPMLRATLEDIDALGCQARVGAGVMQIGVTSCIAHGQRVACENASVQTESDSNKGCARQVIKSPHWSKLRPDGVRISLNHIWISLTLSGKTAKNCQRKLQQNPAKTAKTQQLPSVPNKNWPSLKAASGQRAQADARSS